MTERNPRSGTGTKVEQRGERERVEADVALRAAVARWGEGQSTELFDVLTPERSRSSRGCIMFSVGRRRGVREIEQVPLYKEGSRLGLVFFGAMLLGALW